MVSTNTSNAAVMTLGRMIGTCTRSSARAGLDPRVRAAPSMLGVTRDRPESTVRYPSARNRTTYPMTRPVAVPLTSNPRGRPNSLRLIESTALSKYPRGTMIPTASTAPGTA